VWYYRFSKERFWRERKMATWKTETFVEKQPHLVETDIWSYTIKEYQEINPDYPCVLEIYYRRPDHLQSDKYTIQSTVSNVAKDYMKFMKELQGEIAGQNRRVLIENYVTFKEIQQKVYQP